ncbi:MULTISPECIES: undecaprenyl-phosphate glucose phosphotransferase [Klebsiella pneumoniae complex]|uniref:Undecaprenyl-phosphate glucose phosphotransferase n=2 Tax=Klebsiella pneumoniae complex TaxID=3390273 RepID=A0AAW9PFV4_KLEVA|nr:MULTISPECIES: undecaprenyl-phosphate glucose phosphotransferase [Klebsiella]HCT5345502.1 undecaprenyl-phosphate glucose phosphotransferase [Klebsiella quasipneumoniae]EIW8532292.1 undecaprenyl-phosphate glucose phosphotransferase [Klebsiella pneumoniae]EIW8766412.1 undecaprenyl-phosphate glucose phosphotransferase [Klebsiella pneumoniae]MBC4903217.1 undecaprenyl-phosphate glucose phosphotransferase [Klebsiella pneumoniae]MBC4969952.1 undecaprenyl-phosphate glucose phosphotransferase [Klebsi
MKTLTHRTRANANASIISMVQRFSDIAIIFIGLYVICLFNKFSYAYGQVLISLAVLVVFQMIGGITDFYRSWRGVKISSELILIIKNWTLSFIIALGISSLFPIPDVNLNILIQWYLIVVIGFVICRFSIRIGSGLLRKIGCNTRNVAVVGSLPAGINLLRGFMDEPWLGFVVRGVYDDIKLDDYNGVPYGGNINDLIKDAREGKLDRVYIALGMHDEIKIKNIVGQLTDTTCSVLLIPDIFTFNILQSRTEEINGVPVVPLFDTPLNGINMVVKRLEDIVVSSIILLLISPLLACIACAVKFTSPGPVIFRQVRYGMDGKSILVWKFRSMTVMENDNVIQATKNDVRITKIGKFLRSTSLDELPQFFNVFLGQMSVVGPRPHAVAHNEQYRTLIQGYMLRHKVKPGITGLAQINGWRGETDTLDKMEKRIEYDLLYIRGWSIWLDLKIIFLTVLKGFINKSAY